MFRFLGVSLLAVVLGLAGAGSASAQGFGVYEQSACMMGRGGAGVADPCPDGSGIFFNPAGLSVDAKVITFGGVIINPKGSFTDTSTTSMKGTVSTLNNKYYPVPNIYMSLPFAKTYAFGVGVFAPYGLTTDWPEKSQGRFLGYKSVVQGLYIQPTFAVKLHENVSVGVGVDVTYLNVELNQRADLSTQALPNGLTFAALGVAQGTDFADIQLKGHALSYGFHVGAIFRVSDRFSFGMRYLGGQKVDVPDGTINTTQIPAVKPDGTPYTTPIALPGIPAGTPVDKLVEGKFATGQALADQSAKTSMPLPAQFVAGVAIKASQNVKLFFDYQFTDWSSFDRLMIDFQNLSDAEDAARAIPQNYRNVNGFRMGTEIGSEKARFRAGFNVHGPAAPDQTVTPNLPEGSRRELMLGFGSSLSKAFRLDFSYMYLSQPDRAGRTGAGANPAAPTVADNNGTYSFMGHLVGLSMSVRF
jgi:long-chain fatty acid transport protein